MRVTPGDKVVVRGSGLGTVVSIEASPYCELVVIALADGGTQKKPRHRLVQDGVRHLASRQQLTAAFAELRRPRQKIRGSNWNSQQKNLEAAVASCDPATLAGVIRDLSVADGQEKSYERLVLYELALRRLGDECALVLPDVCGTDARGYLESIFAAGKSKRA